MADYAPRRGQDLNQFYSDTNLSLSPYSDGNGGSYLNGSAHAHLHYSQMGPTYSNYSNAFTPSHHGANGLMFISPSTHLTMSYPMQSPRQATIPSQSMNLTSGSYFNTNLNATHPNQPPARYSSLQDNSIADAEEQESANQDSMRSEPITPPLDGYPNVDEFDQLMRCYVSNLSPKKQDKALIHAKRAANIRAVLIDKKTTSIESAQFRFWVKKMFTLEPNDPSIPCRKKKICHEHKPVAIREKLFKILSRAHKQCQHGGRDKTSAQVRRCYSWVPKELISRFVKLCPTCQVRRGTNRGSRSGSVRSLENYVDMQSPLQSSSSQSRRDSIATTASAIQSPVHMAGFSATFQHQNRWMTAAQPLDPGEEQVSKFENVASHTGRMHNPLAYAGLNALPNKRTQVAAHSASMLGIEPTVASYYPSSEYSTIHGFQNPVVRYRFKQEHELKAEKRY